MNTERSTTVLSPPPAAAGTTPHLHDPSCPNHASVPLPDDVAVLHAMIRELVETLKKAHRDREGLQQRIDLLVRKLYGQKAERYDPNQPWLLPEMAPDAANADAATDTTAESDAADDQTATEKPKSKGHGRKPLPKELPRKRTEHTLTEAERLCPCCGVVCQKFGEDVSEQLDFTPASLFVRQHVRFKYACPKCHDHVTVGHVPIAIFNKGLPGPGLLAQIAACKYADHLPLHRLERILARYGIALSRSTMCDWMARIAEMLDPVVALMASIVRESKALHTDATKMPYLDPKVPGKTLSGQMWDYVGDRDHPFNVFDFCRDHSAKGIDAFLQANSYRGYLNADAQNIYDHLFKNGLIIELGCWAHCRRNFYDAKESDPLRAHVALGHIRQLYADEAEANKRIAEQKLTGAAADTVRLQLRQEKSLPELTAFRQWLETEQPKVLPKSLIGLAIAYALRHWQALTRYLADGFLDIDNNAAERTLRHIAIGRKNWLFAGSDRGAETAATLFSVTSSCHRHGVDVFAYLQDILQRLALDPQPTSELLRDWLPDRWKPPAAAQPDSS
ncbi:MAG TPA: IS66 family transposase [Bradyrhizobium sp.]|jgi:transposase|nr:IS66 family transposase [Bradyrhizobium sp.]